MSVSRQLAAEYGRGYAEKNLRRMIQFAEAFPEEEIVVTLSRQLSWSHFSALLPLSQTFQRDFYAEMCRIEGWSVRGLRERIESILYERTALSTSGSRARVSSVIELAFVTSCIVLRTQSLVGKLSHLAISKLFWRIRTNLLNPSRRNPRRCASVWFYRADRISEPNNICR